MAREAADQKQRRILTTFFKPSSTNAASTVTSEDIAADDVNYEPPSKRPCPELEASLRTIAMSNRDDTENSVTETCMVPQVHAEEAANTRSDLVSSDPADWNITDTLRAILVERGPVQDRRYWPVTGTSDWNHLAQKISTHEKSGEHCEAFKQWKEFSSRLRLHQTIDAEHERMMGVEKNYWHEVLKRIIAILQFLAGQSLALRGSSSKLYDCNDGNFLKDHLVQLISAAKYYSIILDCTPDKSRQEQLSIIIRFVTFDDRQNTHQIREHFFGFLPVVITTGEGLTNVILDQLNNLGIPIGNMRGQGYDNGANMKGKRSGVQNRILQINPRATFVPCSCHSLNLVVHDAAAASGETVGFFDIIQQLYVFFSGSTMRWDVLKRHITSLTVKAVSTTRWESRIDALKPLRFQLGEVYDALIEISMGEGRDKLTQHEAKSLAARISDFKFICSILIWYDVLSKVNIVSKMLQSPELHISDCSQLLSEVSKFLQEYRSDESFANLIERAKDVATEVEVEPCFQPISGVRMRRKKRHFDYESQDETLSDPTAKFRVDFFHFIIDTAMSSIEERFKLLRSHNDHFQFLYNITNLRAASDSDVLKACQKLSKFLTDGDSTDIDDAIDFCQELKDLSTFLPKNSTPLEVLNHLHKYDMKSMYPNTVVALRILLTLPVSVASGDRSFSKLKIIKNYLRSTMSQERLVGLSTISIESDLCESLDYDELIAEFARIKARKVQL
ncbi:zinc finger MYM-type protein 1-like [Diprion similis]|uniref:zinc finger MYM-type protein 1-like n=1 Tax=Diprion similis TaxID=362088 RepID=UPI001EF953B6|nr:zinc finger MYM-type protein 1-like [Diprion similis]